MISYDNVTEYLKDRKEFTVPDLQKEFSADYYSVYTVVQKLLFEGLISLKEGLVYGLTEAGEKKFLPRKRSRANSESDDDDDDDDDEDDNPFRSVFERRRHYLEQRRQELVRKMTQDDGISPVLHEAYRVFTDYANAEQEGDAYTLTFNGGISLGGTRLRLKLYEREDGVYLSDGGMTLSYIREASCCDPSAAEEAAEYLETAVFENGEIRLKVEQFDEAVSCLMILYSAMQEVFIAAGGRKAEKFTDEELSDLLEKLGITSDDDGETDGETDGTREDGGTDEEDGDGGEDDYEDGVLAPKPDSAYVRGLAHTVKTGKVSLASIQRVCGVGYNHAMQIVDWMEAMGYISLPQEGTGRRKVMLTRAQFEERFGPLD